MFGFNLPEKCAQHEFFDGETDLIPREKILLLLLLGTLPIHAIKSILNQCAY